MEGTSYSAVPEDPQSQWPVSTPAEREEVLYRFNRTAGPYPQDRLIHELFEDQVKAHPLSVAVVSGEAHLTYAELNCKANRLAAYLRSEGLRIGEYVPIRIFRSIQMIIAQLGVLKAGGVYVPLNPDLPEGRQRLIISSCGARWIVVDQRPAAHESHRLRWIACDEADETGGGWGQPEKDVRLGLCAKSPAYVMYTSGTTGIPNGVVIPQQAVNRLVINNRYACIGPDDCIAHCSNPEFDASTFEVWGALLNGAKLVIVPKSTLLDRELLSEMLRRYRVTIMFMTTSLFSQYATALRQAFSELRCLLVGGEVLSPNVVRNVFRVKLPINLINVYGPTESTTFATSWPVLDVAKDETSLPIGRPISNTQVYILDAKKEPVPIGVPGEIYIGGPGVALGYLNRPEFTAERFVPDMFGHDPQCRLFSTGDMGRWRGDGNIDFLGRKDRQVKLRGFRIELEEIETHLRAYPGVREVVVIAREDIVSDCRLTAYLTANEGVELSVAALRTYMANLLPEYMVPHAYVVLEKLPLTPNGKVDQVALPIPNELAVVSRGYEPPQGEIEAMLTTAWQDTLGVAQVSRHDDFFELGGNSLLGMKLISGVGRSFGIRLPFVVIFQHPTILEMAKVIEGTVDGIEQGATVE